jgi:hypothetical protein
LSCFKVFDCKGVFNIILGKPWLKVVRAHHDYVMDKITIRKAGQQEVISNILNTPAERTTEPDPETNNTILTEQSQAEEVKELETHPEEQLAREWT